MPWYMLVLFVICLLVIVSGGCIVDVCFCVWMVSLFD